MKILIKLLFVLFISSVVSYSFAAKKASCNPNDDTVKLIQDMVKPGNEKLATAIKKNQELASAWVLLKSSDKKRTATELLAGIIKHFKDPPFSNDKKLRDDYIKAVLAYTGKISTNPNGGYKNLPDKAEDYFNALFEYTKKYSSHSDFELPDYKNQKFSQDGFYLTMRYMNSNKVSKSEVKSLDMKFESDEGGCPDCRFDARLNDGTLIEFKSYTDPSKIPLKQFKAYVGNVDSLDQLRYVFNKDKATISQAKDGMSKVISNNKAEIWDAMSDGVKQSLFPGQDLTLLSEDDLSPTVINQMVNQFVEVY